VGMLETSWIRDVYPLQVSMAEYDRLAKPLVRYAGSILIQMWHVDYLLIGCRRLVDDGTDVISIRRALINLRRVGDDLTPGVLATYRSHRGVGAEAAAQDAVEDDLERELGTPRGAFVGKQGVQPDLDTIGMVADRVKRLVTHGVAHRLDKPKPLESPEARWRNSSEIYMTSTYAGPSCCVQLTYMPPPGEQNMLHPVVRALELFDWEAYVDAQSEALSNAGPLAGIGFEDLDRRARIVYRFD